MDGRPEQGYGLEENRNEVRVELLPGPRFDDSSRLGLRVGGSVRAVMQERIPRVREGDDPRGKRDFETAEPIREPAAVPVFLMVTKDVTDAPEPSVAEELFAAYG